MNAPLTTHAPLDARRRPGSRNSYSPSVIPGLAKLLDIGMIALSASVMNAFSEMAYLSSGRSSFCYFGFLLLYVWLASHGRLYEMNAIIRPIPWMDCVLIVVTTTLLFIFAAIFSLELHREMPLTSIAQFAMLSFGVIFLGRVIGARVLGRLIETRFFGSTLVVLGAGDQARAFLRQMADVQPHFVRIAGVFDPNKTNGHPEDDKLIESHRILGGIDELLVWARTGRIDDVVIALPWSADRAVIEAIEALKELPLNVYLSTDLIGFKLRFTQIVGNYREISMFEVLQKPISGWSYALKRMEDYILASVLLILLLPLFLIVAILIKIDSPGPVFFMQKRLGFNNEEFLIYKFRSMYHRREPETVVLQASRRDPRITRVGRILRSTSIDELPQLLNVLNGSMSLVGPRPHAVSHNEEYGRKIRGYFARHRVRPGITGWAQVNGLRGETDTVEKMAARIRYDIYYADNWSLFFDLKILLLTAAIVLFQRNAY